MDDRWTRGTAVFGGAIGALAVMTTITRLIGTDDVGLLLTFVALGSASFAIALQDRLRTRRSRGSD
ncbi:MAG: hypothetical protein V2J24_19815 [Pseudomonadales bacterium]|jgi:hypothetical protein|nr:hypothetical protein [Pseudomonadales bacterium]